MQKISRTNLRLQEELIDCRRRISELESSEKEFRQLNEKFQDYFDNIEEGCFEVDLHGHFLFCNRKTQEILGYDLDDYKTLSHHKRHPTREEADRVFRTFNELYKTGNPLKAFEYKIIRKDGETRTVEVSVALIRDAEGRPLGFRGVGRDVTDRIEMTKTLERYRDFVENVEDICAEYDLKGRCVFCNKAMAAKLGYKQEEYLLTEHWERHPFPRDTERVYKIFNEIYRTGIPVTYEETVLHKDGTTVSPVEISVTLMRDSNGNRTGFRSIGRDITDRNRMLKDLEKYKDFIENVADACIEYDLQGRCVFCNDAAARIVGYTREEYIQLRHHERHVSKEENDRVFKIFNEIYRTGVPAQYITSETLCKDGSVKYLEIMVSLIRTPDGKAAGFRCISRDITERKRLEAEQERYRRFVENVTDGCFELNLDGRMIFCNDAFLAQVGYSREEYVALKRWEMIPTRKEADQVAEVYTEILRTGKPVHTLEHRIKRKNGEIRFVELSISLIKDESGHSVGFRCIGRDVTERKENEAEKERYRTFVENVEDACFEVDLGGNITFANHMFDSILGYSHQEIIGLNNRAYTKPKTAIRAYKTFNAIYRTGLPATILDYEVIRHDGETRYLELTASLILDSAGKPVGFRGICRDITERRQMLREQEKYRNFIENIEDACFETDLAGKIVFGNEALQRLTGYPLNELFALWPQDLNHKDYEKIQEIYKKTFRTGEPTRLFDHEIICKDGSKRNVQTSVSIVRDKEGNPVGFRGIGRDVTEWKAVEKAQERYLAFLENVEDSCWELNLAGDYTFANQTTYRMLGYNRDELMALKRQQRGATKEENDRMFKIFNEIYRTGVPITGILFQQLNKAGEVRTLEMSVSLIRDEDRKPLGFRGISRDVTERKRLTEQLNQAQKLEAIGTLAGGVAHDFNNLLMGIQGYTSLMLLDIDAANPNYEKLKAIESQVKSGADLTKQLLGYARGGRYEVKPIDMNDLINKTTIMFGRTKKELRIHQNFAQDLWRVETDRSQMEQVLLNLFVNAWQAMPGGGYLYLETGNIMLDEAYAETFGLEPGSYVKISVTDTGVGMDDLTKSRIFEPFFTTKEMGRGAGLGLASVYGIVRGHKGAIHVYSEKGQGSTFTIYLPASKKDAVTHEERANKLVRGHETILLVDDEQIITDVTGAMIRELGYDVIIARSGEEAVEIYRTNKARIDMIIMDMMMPGAGGGMAIDKIHAINPDARIILSSGYSLNGEAKDIIDRGAAKSFLQKPFPFESLSQKIREVLES